MCKLNPDRDENLRLEYEKTQDMAVHYDTLNWTIGSILVAGIFLGIGTAGDKIEVYLVFAILSFIVLLVWRLYYHRHKGIQELKFNRLHEIERELNLDQHRRVKRIDHGEIKSLFNWDNIPGDDDDKLLKFLKDDIDINWMKNARIEKEDRYLFSWDDIPGNDNQGLIEFLKKRFGIDWVETAEIKKIDDGRTIKLSFKHNFLSLKLHDEKTMVNLKIDDGRTSEFIAITENGKLNIYDKTISVFFTEKKSVEIVRDKKKKKLMIQISDGRAYNIDVKETNGNIYEVTKRKIFFGLELGNLSGVKGDRLADFLTIMIPFTLFFVWLTWFLFFRK